MSRRGAEDKVCDLNQRHARCTNSWLNFTRMRVFQSGEASVVGFVTIFAYIIIMIIIYPIFFFIKRFNTITVWNAIVLQSNSMNIIVKILS